MAGFTADEISHIYELPFKLSLDVRLSVFQFKINHNILYTKSRLFRDKITDNDKCYLCSGSQTLVHLFVDCDFSKVFWIDFTSWWNCKNNTQIELHPRDILFAFHPGKQSFLGINYCLLVARNYIYISAKNEDPFCFCFTVMIRFSALLPISAPFRISAPFECVFVNKHPYSKTVQGYSMSNEQFTRQGSIRRYHRIRRRGCGTR